MAEDASPFPILTASQLAVLEPLGTRRRVDAGEYLYRAGDSGYDFYVVLSGRVDIVVGSGADERLVAQHAAGSFLGELNMMSGLRVFVSARVAERAELLAIPVATLRQVISTQPQLSDVILAAFIARRSALMTAAASSIRVISSRFSPDWRVREFLVRTGIPHEWLDPDRDPEVDQILSEMGIRPSELPVVIATGTVLRRPTPGELAHFLGLTLDQLPQRSYDLIVVGGGPAGLAACVYGASEGLTTLGIEAVAPGGQAGHSSRIENYLGFPTGISGSDLARRAIVQAEKFGATLTTPCAVTGLRDEGGHLVLGLSDGSEVVGRAVIAATGARYRRLEATRIEDFDCKSVYYAATDMEARLCATSPVVVVGGGNSAGQAAVFLAESGSPVTLLIRGPDLNAHMSRYLVDRITENPKIDLRTNTTVVALDGGDSLQRIVVAGPDGEAEIPCVGLFSFIGADPESEWLSGCAALDKHEFVLTDLSLSDNDLDERWQVLDRRPLPFETSHPGLFVVGDLRSGSTKRVAAAVGEGSAAVRSVHEYLSFTH